MSKPDKIRDDILQAALKIAPFEGWTALTLKRAVRERSYPDGMAELYFEGGVGDLLTYWSTSLDNQAAAEIAKLDLDALKIRERRASSRLVLPDLAATGIKQIWQSSDMIWRAIGDTSTDANYYSKRAILSSVIGSTLPVWLSDQSEGKVKARAFLDDRIENVMSFEKIKWRVKSATKDFPNPAQLLGQLRYGGLDVLTRPKKGRSRRRRYSR